VQYFAEIGGFDLILSVLRMGTQSREESKEDQDEKHSAQPIELDMISYLLSALKNIGSVVSPSFKHTLCKQV
jgi:hypothetical protein